MELIITHSMLMFLLAMLLFWQKRKMSLLILVHIVIVSALFARGYILYPSNWSPNSLEDDTWLFNVILDMTQNLVCCFVFF